MMKKRCLGLVSVILVLALCGWLSADTVDLSSAGFNFDIDAGVDDVEVIAFGFDTGGNDTTINFRRLNDDGSDSWMMPVDFTSTYIEVDSDYGPYRANIAVTGENQYEFTLNRSNGLWSLEINGEEVDFVATASTTNPQPDGNSVTVDVNVPDKYFSDESPESAQNAIALGWESDAPDGVGGTGAYRLKFSQASGAYVTGLVFYKARNPVPEDTEIVSFRDYNNVTLSWTAGDYAASHDVYFGSAFADVNIATTASAEFLGNQAEASLKITSGMTIGDTYYWRVDEVNGVDTWKGDVWSFVYPPTPVNDDMVIWYKCDEGEGSVLTDSVSDCNGAIASAMYWEDDAIGFDPGQWGGSGITFDTNDVTAAFSSFDKQATVAWWAQRRGGRGNSQIIVASNDENNRMLFCHIDTDATEGKGHFMVAANNPDLLYYWEIDNPEDDRYIPLLDRWHHFAFSKDADSPYIKIYIDGVVVAQSTVRYNWGGTQDGSPLSLPLTGITQMQFGASSWHWYVGLMKDVRFYDRALTDNDVDDLTGDFPFLAKGPDPADEATDVPLIGTLLTWEPGRDIESHQVYFGTNMVAVRDADVNSACYMGEVATPEYNPGDLDLMETYYWRVDEIADNGNVYPGEVWQFDSIQYVMVEDFEAYDDDGNDIGAVWTDTIGWGDIQITRADDPNISPVNSMKLRYHVPYDPYYAIAARSFSPAQDWTIYNVKLLTINYYGTVGNFDLPVFVTIGDGTTDANVVVDANTTIEGWQQINVSLPEIEAAGVDLTNITYLEIGFGDGTNLGMSSSAWDVIYVDDISLYPPKCVVSESGLMGDITEDCVVDYDDLDALAYNWLLSGYTVSAAASVSDDDLVLHYDFDGNTNDSVAGNNGTLQSFGSSASFEAGYDGQCIHFNATASTSGSNMVVPPAAFADVNEEVTFSFWLKNDTAAPAWYQNTFGGTDNAGERSHLFMHYSPAYQTNMVSVFHAGSGGNLGWAQWDAVSFTQPSTFDYTAWNHIALVKNCFNGEMWMYTNGQLSAYRRGEINKMYGCDEFKLGSLYGDSACYQGSFDDFRVYNRALSHAEILALAGQSSATVALDEFGGEDSDVNGDDAVDFKDYSVLADEWLVEDLWP